MELIGPPLVLLGAAGWRVDYVDEQSDQQGVLRFVGGSGVASSAGLSGSAKIPNAQLNWRGGAQSARTRNRELAPSLVMTAPVLETIAHIYQYGGHQPGQQETTAFWVFEDRVCEFRASVAEVDAFKVLLGSLRRVDSSVWLSALPDSVVKPADRGDVIASMLRGMPLPPGFDPRAIKAAGLVKNRYDLGTAVAGTVACTWFSRWSEARRCGDAGRVSQAIDAMATAKDWPILREMATSGDYPCFVEAFAAAMPSGRWSGRPLEGDVNTGLGCPALGVLLAGPDAAAPRSGQER